MTDTTIKERLAADLKEAMRAQDDVRRRTLRALQSALTRKEIAEREGGAATLSEEQELAVLQKEAKQRRESIEQFEEAGRDDLAEREREELAVIQEYLPQQLSAEEIRDAVQAIVDDVGATSMADMGAVMGRAMGALRGRADGNRVREIVEEILRG